MRISINRYTKLIFMELTRAGQLSVKNAFIECHGNSTYDLVADTRSQTDGQMYTRVNKSPSA